MAMMKLGVGPGPLGELGLKACPTEKSGDVHGALRFLFLGSHETHIFVVFALWRGLGAVQGTSDSSELAEYNISTS